MASSSTPSRTSIDRAEDLKFRTEDDLRTLIRAQEIRKDAARLKAAKALAKERADTLSKITPA